MPFPPQVIDSATAIQFVFWCINKLGMGYHPDTPFNGYVDSNGNPIFVEEESQQLELMNDAVFKFIDPYEIGLAEFRRKMGYEFDSAKKISK